jgi:hypothetical protein
MENGFGEIILSYDPTNFKQRKYDRLRVHFGNIL